MNITYLELPAKDLTTQQHFYSSVLDLPVTSSADILEVQAGATRLIFTQADSDFDGAYHFAFNIPENQFHAAKEWLSYRTPLLSNTEGKNEFSSQSWNSDTVYFKDPAGNVLEFIARHDLENSVVSEFDSEQILNVSEIGLPSEDVIVWANELCTKLGISVFRQEPSETFTPVGDNNGLFIIPIKNRIWIPNSGVPARLLPVRVQINVGDKTWEVCGMPYRISAGL